MRTIFKWLVRTLVVFLILCAISYQDDTAADGDLRLGFPRTIYHKSVNVMHVVTGERGDAERFYTGNLFIDIAFAFIIALVLMFMYKKIVRRRKGEQ